MILTFKNMKVDWSLLKLRRLARVLPGIGRLGIQDGQCRHGRPLGDVLGLRRLHPAMLKWNLLRKDVNIKRLIGIYLC